MTNARQHIFNSRLKTLTMTLFAGTAVFAISSASPAAAQEPLIELTIEDPGGPSADKWKPLPPKRRFLERLKRRLMKYYSGDVYRVGHEKTNRRRKRPRFADPSVMFEDGWNLSFRLSAPESVAVLSTRLSTFDSGPNFETLVLRDADDCLDLTNAFPEEYLLSGNSLFRQPVDEGCDTGPNEDFLLYNQDRFDQPGVNDSYVFGGCEGPARDALIDDLDDDVLSGIVNFREANKPYVDRRPTDGFLNGSRLGPSTGGTASITGSEDCYGYGADEDLKGLVVMVNLGAARVFNPDTLEYLDQLSPAENPRIRNMAALVSGISTELLDRSGATTIVADMDITPKMLAPLTFFDVERDLFPGSGDPITGDVIIKRKIEDGPIEEITITGATTNADIINALIELSPSEYTVEVRAVVLNQRAPAFIEDLNFDGEFTAEDLTLAGFTLLSNEAVRTIDIVSRPSITQETQDFECPDNLLVFVDLDRNGVLGGCDDGDGTSRSRVRVPR